MITRVDNLYDRQNRIKDLHPPEKVMIYVMGSILINQRYNKDILLHEIIEGLILIGVLEITFVVPDEWLQNLTSSGIYGSWVLSGKKLIEECRPYVKYDIVNTHYATENAEELDLDDIIIVQGGEPTEADIEFLGNVEDAYMICAGDYYICKYQRPVDHLIRKDFVTNPLEEREPPAVEIISSMQVLLLMNIISKPSTYRHKEIELSAVEFVDSVVGDAIEELRINRNLARSTPVHTHISIKTEEDIDALLCQHECKTLTDLSRKLNLNPSTVRTRIKLGWSVSEALGLEAQPAADEAEFGADVEDDDDSESKFEDIFPTPPTVPSHSFTERQAPKSAPSIFDIVNNQRTKHSDMIDPDTGFMKSVVGDNLINEDDSDNDSRPPFE
jgi:hypothetical protein